MFDNSRAHFMLADRGFRIEEFHTADTYAGCLEGRPSVAEMTSIIARRVVQMYGPSRPTVLVIPPHTTDRLPQYVCSAWVDSTPLRDEHSCGSYIILVWFMKDDPLHASPIDLVQKELASVDWNRAEDWEP